MTSLGNHDIDANFFQLIHQLADLAGDDVTERRGRWRRLFAVVQRIAIVSGAGVPDESNFFEVKCHDLTQRGFSFFLPTRPNYDSVVVAFGVEPEIVYVEAKITHCASVLLHPSGVVEHIRGQKTNVSYKPSGDGKCEPMVLVGCRFTKRLSRM